MVARLEVDLRAEVPYPDRRVTVRIEPERPGTTSLTTRETILTPSGQVAAEARVVTVRWDAGFVAIAMLLSRPTDVAARPGLLEKVIALGADCRNEPIPAPSRGELLSIVAGD